MASTSHNQTSHPTKWDVFLSFRGIDTRDSFTDFLYHSLHRTGIRTFMDDPELRSGEVISDALIEAIHDSKTYIVVFSENYASSSWCLDELVQILDRHRSMSRLVLPVFYYIEPSVVKYQTGSFNKAFQTHESHDTRYERGRLDRWCDALTEVGKFSGYHVFKNMSQADIINKIVNRALQEVNPMTLDVAKYQVGLDPRIEDIATLLSNVTAPVIRMGIYGMGGIGKTTIAKAVYNQNYRHFKGSCFLENVREASQTRKGIAGLQQKLVNDVLKCKNIIIDNADQGIEIIRARICSAEILIVFDDLDSRMPLEYLEGPFALGSTVIITTRCEDLLDSIKIEAKYRVNKLDDIESRQLFCRHAFGGDNRMPETFIESSKEILKFAGGLPLALKVCGSALLNESEEGWGCYIDKLRRVSTADVEEILLISFYELVDPMLKEIFLDIACFFIGHEEEDVVKIMETYYTHVNHNIGILSKRCLLTVNHGRYTMHDLIRDMGRKIACNNFPCEHEKHSRLWVREVIYETLNENTGTKAIEGIIPSDFCLYSKYNFKAGSVFVENRNHFAAETFKKMTKLRFLYLDNVKLTGSFEHTFKDLRWLYWWGCPLKCLPLEFHPQKLVFLALPGSQMKTVFEPNMGFEKLKTLDVSYSTDLTTTDFTKLPFLETLILKGCKSLEEVHISIGSLGRLVSLNLQGCKNLKGVPDSICNLRALKSLNVAHCSNLKAFPMNLGNMESLVELNAEGTIICILPHSIGRLSKLIELNLRSCRNLETLPDTICKLRSLEVLVIDKSNQLEALPMELGNLESLVKLHANELIVSKLPDSIGRLSKLVNLYLSCCCNLKTLPDTICNMRSLKILNISWCTSLEALPTELGNLDSLVELNARCLTVASLPDSIGCLNKLVKLDLSYCKKLKTLPDTICNLRLLEILDISCCNHLEALPEEWGNLESLINLSAWSTNVSRLPDSVGRLSKLVELNLSQCTNLKSLPDTICNLSSLKTLKIGSCKRLEALPADLENLQCLVELSAMNVPSVLNLLDWIWRIRSLEILDLSHCDMLSIVALPSNLKRLSLAGCSSLVKLPNLSNLKQLKILNLSSCSGLTEIQGLEELTSIEILQLRGCNSSLLEYTFTKRFFQIYSGFGHRIDIYTQSSMFPHWINQSTGSTVSLDLPPNASHNFLGIILCSKISGSGNTCYSVNVKTTTNDCVWRYNLPSSHFHPDDYDGIPHDISTKNNILDHR